MAFKGAARGGSHKTLIIRDLILQRSKTPTLPRQSGLTNYSSIFFHPRIEALCS
jgi:hypothetical protein